MIKMHEIEVTNENFEETVLKSDRTVLLDFWAPWCNPCRMLGPVVSEIASEHADTLTVGKVNVDEQPELSAKLRISFLESPENSLLPERTSEILSISVIFFSFRFFLTNSVAIAMYLLV